MKKLILFVILFSFIQPQNSVAANQKTCTSKQINLIKNNLICKKSGKTFLWLPYKKTNTVVNENTNSNQQPILETSTVVIQETKTVTKETVTVAEVLDPNKAILANALDQIRNHKSNKKNNVELTFYVEDNFPQNYLEYIKQGQQNVLDAYLDNIKDGRKIYVIAANSKDFTVNTLNTINSLIGSDGQWIQRNITNQLPNLFNADGFGNGNANGAITGPPGSPVVVIYSARPGYIVRKSDEEVGAHEFFHIVQNDISNQKFYSLPCWMIEGEASMFATGLFNKNESATDSANRIKSFYMGPKESFDLSTIESCGAGVYRAGRVANALLINNYGVDKELEFLSKSQENINWKDLFFSVFGIKVSDFYEKAKEYINWFYYN
jgi:hypothetical protein